MTHFKECPVCKSIKFTFFFRIGSRYLPSSEKYTYMKCECGVIFQNPMLAPDELKEEYNSMPRIREHNSQGLASILVYLFDTFCHSTYSKILRPLASDKSLVLDYGAGEGNILSLLKGVIPKKNLWALELCADDENRLSKNFSIYKESQWRRAELKFDLIISYGVLEHLHNPVDWIQNARRNQQNGAYLFLTLPNIDSWQFCIFKKFWAAVYAPQHLFFFSGNSFQNLLNQNGYEIIERFNFDRRSDPALLAMTIFKNLDPTIIAKDENKGKFVIHRKAFYLFTYSVFLFFTKVVSSFSVRPAMLQVLCVASDRKN